QRIRRDILDKRHTVHSITGVFKPDGEKLSYTEADDSVMRKLKELYDRYLAVADHLENSDSRVAVVFNPDYLSLRESQRIFSGLNDLNIKVDVALNNKYTPGLREIADEMEAELFNGMSDRPVLARIPWEPYRRDRAYEIGYDLASMFP
ncbi:MAG: ArsA-related P-loop ATPase, partial [Alkalispirochaeta sp.]